MDRSTIYSQEQARLFDIQQGWKDGLKGNGYLAQALLGSLLPVVSGFSASQQATPNMTINLALGQIYTSGQVDPTPWGGSPSDTSLIVQQGIANAAQILSFTTAGLTAGQQQYCLISAAFSQVDSVRAGDPTGGVLPYYNSALPSQALQGPGGGGSVQATVRQGLVSITQTYGAPASTGSAVPPAVPANNVPMYLLLLTFGQGTITNGQIVTAGPAAYTGYQQAPFLAGLLQQHHGGTAGQAPQIDATFEIKNILGLPHLPVTNTAPPVVSANITLGGTIPVALQGIVNPNGNVAGAVGDQFLNTATGAKYECTAAGSSSTAIWSSIGGATASPLVLVTAWPYTVASNFVDILGDVTSGSGTLNLQQASTVPAAQIGVQKRDSSPNSILVTPSSTFTGPATAPDIINYGIQTGLTSLAISTQGNKLTFRPLYDSTQTRWVWYVQ